MNNIFTTYWANLKNLPEDIIPVGICGRSIPGWNGLEYKKLAPSWSIYKEYKDSGDKERYTRRFTTEILGKLDPALVIEELNLLSGGKDIALVCYEKPGDFCHRHLVATWLGHNIREL